MAGAAVSAGLSYSSAVSPDPGTEPCVSTNPPILVVGCGRGMGPELPGLHLRSEYLSGNVQGPCWSWAQVPLALGLCQGPGGSEQCRL